MRVIVAVFLVGHGLIHLLGVARAFGLAELPQLSSIPPSLGLLWLAAAVLFCAAGAALFVWPQGWWAIGTCAVIVSTIAIAMAWTDAKIGALGNLIAIVMVFFGFMTQGPVSLRAAYNWDVGRGLARLAPAAPITEADLAHLPEPVRRYLRIAGVVGQPRVSNFHVRMRGRIRSARDARWMPLQAEQYSFTDEPARFFYLTASMFMIPVQGYHRYAGASAAMRIRAAAVVPVASASGEEMHRAETVTMFNDMCLLAPATLVDPAIVWESVDGRTSRATFTSAGHSIRAELSFNEAGELVDFSSDDRYQASADGKRFARVRWSTPVSAYRSFGRVRLAAHGEARWHEADGEYSYIEIDLDRVEYNVASRR